VTERFVHVEKRLDELFAAFNEVRTGALKVAAAAVLALAGVQAGTSYLIEQVAGPGGDEPQPSARHEP
jgi:hypothetical protein